MSQSDNSFSKKFADFQPSKTLWFWTSAGCVIATIVIGFTAGGWVTGGTAQEMATTAAEDGRAELAASLCVNQFASAPDAAAQFAALKEASSWERDDLIEEGGWAALPGGVEVVDGSIDLCAEKIAALETLPVPEGGTQVAAEDAIEASEEMPTEEASATDDAALRAHVDTRFAVLAGGCVEMLDTVSSSPMRK